MNKPVTRAVIEAGLVEEATIDQLRRWGLLNTDAERKNIEDPQQVVNNIREALEGEEVVAMRATDLDLIRQYLSNSKKGRLFVPADDDKKTASLTVEYAVTVMGSYVIPWTSESIKELLLHDKTYLKTAEGHKVRFAHINEVYYDDKKAFVVCAPLER
jgi:hypothetical protein